MGGCASKPKESVPGEAPASPKQAETQQPVAQESQNEAPLVDVSEPKKEGESATETKDADAEVVPAVAAEDVSAKPEEGVKVEAKPETEKEDDDKVKVEAAGETQEKPNEGHVKDVAPASEDKSDAPLVTV